MVSDLERYVSDNALQFFGVSEKRMVDFIIASATKAKSPDAFYSTLSSSGLSDSAAAQSFASEVYNRVPRKHKTKKPEDVARKLAEKEAKLLQKQQFAYLLDDD
ncbi:hypothetical protein PENSPDRAFT_592711, partial [Peniophora sp. CONT]